jgi:hypothetical protein
MVLTGCASMTPTKPSDVAVSAQHLSKDCQLGARDGRVAISIKNGGLTSIAFPVQDPASPPYSLFPANYEVLVRDEATQEFTPWTVVIEHFYAPKNKVVLQAGDTEVFLIPFDPLQAADLPKIFAVQVTDSTRQGYVSAPFALCPRRSVPNNSFKPKPLRGSA